MICKHCVLINDKGIEKKPRKKKKKKLVDWRKEAVLMDRLLTEDVYQ